VTTEQPANNTVHCEFYLPREASAERPAPGVVVLHILGGDFMLSRAFCQQLANQGVAALFVKMPHYGERRTPNANIRMISEDPHQTVAGMRQAVLDVRRATAFLAEHPSINADRLGIMGISLGGIVSALAAESEPRLGRAALLLAGGDIARVAWDSPEVAKVRRKWEAQGGTRQSLVKVLAPIDPVYYAKNLHGRKVLMMNASRDEVIPPECTTSLWVALGHPEIVWWDAGHISAARYLLPALQRVGRFFSEP